MTQAVDPRAGASSDQPAQPGSTFSPGGQPLIRASELAEYSFCQRAWWLNVVRGISSHNQVALTRGVQTHRRHSSDIQAALNWRKASFFLFGGGGLLLIVTAFYYFLS